MEKKEQVLDDIARVAGGAVNVITNFARTTSNTVRKRSEEFAHRLDAPTKDEFEALKAQVAELEKRIKKLEKPAAKKTAAKKTAAKKPAAKKTAAKKPTTKKTTTAKK